MAKELAISKSLNVKGYSSPNIFDNGLGSKFAFLSSFPIRERLWYNLEKLFNNKSASNKEKRPETRNEKNEKNQVRIFL